MPEDIQMATFFANFTFAVIEEMAPVHILRVPHSFIRLSNLYYHLLHSWLEKLQNIFIWVSPKLFKTWCLIFSSLKLLLLLWQKLKWQKNIHLQMWKKIPLDQENVLPFELPMAMFISYDLIKLTNKHCQKIFKWQLFLPISLLP